MATAAQIAKKMEERVLEAIEVELQALDKALRKYEPLLDQKRKLEGARRAILSTRSPTAGGGRGLTQEEVVSAMTQLGPSTVHAIAEKLSATPGAVRAHLNRGVDERFSKDGSNLWSVREPEEDEDEAEEE